jgi:hypothetical protein
MRFKRPVVLIIGGIIIGAGAVWITHRNAFPRERLNGPVETLGDGHERAERLIRRVDREAYCYAAGADLQDGPDGFEPRTLEYLFLRGHDSYAVRVDNTEHSVGVVIRGEGMQVEEARAIDESAYRAIDWQALAVDVPELLRLAEQEYESRRQFVNKASEVYVNIVWRSGRQTAGVQWEDQDHGHRGLLIDTLTGDVIEDLPRPAGASLPADRP